MPSSRSSGRVGAAAGVRPIKAGDLLRLDRRASVQFCRLITVRVIREITDRQPFDGWSWIEAYELNCSGVAVAKRELFVWLAGLRRLNPRAGERPIVSGRAAERLGVPA
ncbi:hypothetical protein O7600_09265 [Micromonospora sp. WMMA1998]|uniref:hypothetical protein n=1 Tax=Micromonospora sp. WMMA1998 TaxID=3015167 RepID=UPI00248CE1CB|nr:hypothetical protein [Micromonospora sp. WMMA1998]WBC16998.1 hypothetical protein O7600_09265 [Micromonospora sp. WMMA1998]